MKRRRFLLSVVTAIALAAACGAGAQSPARISRVGFLALGSAATSPSVDAFRQGLRDLGYVEGHNLALEFRWAEGRFERLPGFAQELVRWKPDLLVTVAPQGLQAVRSVTGSIPVIIIACDPAESIVHHIARPSGHIIGVTCMASDITPKRLQLLKETVPRIRRVAVLYNPFDPNKADEVREMHAVAGRLGISLRPIEVREGGELEKAVANAVRERVDALFVLNDPLMFMERHRIAEIAAKHRLPAMYAFSEYVDAGGLISYGTMQNDLFRRAAAHADKVLRGAKTADVPVEQATLFELVVNLKTAKALGVTIPRVVLMRADRVIE